MMPASIEASVGIEALVLLRREMQALADPVRAAGAGRFFKTGPGEYGAGDCFLGVTVPQVRSLLPRTDRLGEPQVRSLLRSRWHEERLLALLLLVRRFASAKSDPVFRHHLVKIYLANTRWINNWDLVDSSAPPILGTWLRDHDRSVLKQLAASNSLWEQRIAILATLALIRVGEFQETLWLCESLLAHPHDLLHKACGWILREVGKRDPATLRSFLDRHVGRMPRTMLGYALERLPEELRRNYRSLPRRV